jgi:hypothetical protein
LKKSKALKRVRVNRALESIFDYPMTIVEAPIGYGKTTAVREFLALKGSPVIWTSYLSEDDTPASFWDRSAAEFGKIDEAAGIKLRSHGVPSDTPQTTMVISIFNEMNYKPNTTLVVDDFRIRCGDDRNVYFTARSGPSGLGHNLGKYAYRRAAAGNRDKRFLRRFHGGRYNYGRGWKFDHNNCTYNGKRSLRRGDEIK